MYRESAPLKLSRIEQATQARSDTYRLARLEAIQNQGVQLDTDSLFGEVMDLKDGEFAAACTRLSRAINEPRRGAPTINPHIPISWAEMPALQRFVHAYMRDNPGARDDPQVLARLAREFRLSRAERLG